MNKNIFAVSSRLGLPYWWVESVAIEYLECREFAGGDEIWTFNFELVSETELVKAAESERVVVSGPLIHYPQFDRKSMLKSLEKYFMGREDDDAGEHIVEGLCSKDDFPEEVEFLEFWDPKISFSEYFAKSILVSFRNIFQRWLLFNGRNSSLNVNRRSAA